MIVKVQKIQKTLNNKPDHKTKVNQLSFRYTKKHLRKQDTIK